MCVLSIFYINWELEGGKNFREIVRVGLQETNNFFYALYADTHHMLYSTVFSLSVFTDRDQVYVSVGGLIALY